MVDPIVAVAAGLVAALAIALLLLLRRASRLPGLEALRAEQAQVLASVAGLVEASRSEQAVLQGLQASVAEHRQQVEGLKASLEATAQALAEVKQGAEAQRAAEEARAASLGLQIAEAKQMLERARAQEEARAAREQEAFEGLARLEAIIAGTKSRGTAGENMLAEVIKQLPPEFRAYDVRINGKAVEFAIPLPDGRYLPVDSKWPGVERLERLAACPPEERPALVEQIEADVEAKVDEVAKYLDPERTCMMAVLAVPDAVYDLCARAHVEAHKRGVVLVAYSMAVPYVLTVLQVIRRFGARVDEAQLSHMVQAVLGALEEMLEELDGRFARSLTQLDNSKRALKASVGKAQQALGRVQVQVGNGGNGEVAPAAES